MQSSLNSDFNYSTISSIIELLNDLIRSCSEEEMIIIQNLMNKVTI